MKARRTRKTPFCRVCFNAELPSEIYSSHYTKDFFKRFKKRNYYMPNHIKIRMWILS